MVSRRRHEPCRDRTTWSRCRARRYHLSLGLGRVDRPVRHPLSTIDHRRVASSQNDCSAFVTAIYLLGSHCADSVVFGMSRDSRTIGARTRGGGTMKRLLRRILVGCCRDARSHGRRRLRASDRHDHGSCHRPGNATADRGCAGADRRHHAWRTNERRRTVPARRRSRRARSASASFALATKPRHAPSPSTANETVTADFALGATATRLDQVVVSATGESELRRESGNNVATINTDSIPKTVVNGVSDLLSSRAANVVVTQTSGTTGGGSRIRIRGSNSLSLSNEPLIIIDGVRAISDVSGSTHRHWRSESESSR